LSQLRGLPQNPYPIGLLRTNKDARASRHIGVLYEITLQSADVALALNQKEFRATRGGSMSGRPIELNQKTGGDQKQVTR
jgi:hypothetical protein